MKKYLFALLTCIVCGQVHAQPEPFVLVFLHKRNATTNLPADESKRLMDGHLSNMRKLWNEGKLLIAGPFEGAGGLFVFRPASRAEIDAWLAADPAIQAQRWNLEIVPYYPRTGGICPVAESASMTTFYLLRLGACLRKENVQQADDMAARLAALLLPLREQGLIVAEGSLADDNDLLVILKADADVRKLLIDMPDLYEPLLLTLQIARGSFCEKK